jgi:multiple sugar transport system substrate-binding protein
VGSNLSMTRRSILRASLLAAAVPLLAACGNASTASTSSGTVSAGTASTSSAAPTTAATSSAATTTSAPATTTASSAATTSAATTASASSAGTVSTTASASSSAAATSSAASSAAAASTAPAATPTFVPVTAALPQPTKSAAKLNGTWTVLQNQDFNPEFNAYVRKGITDFAKFQGWKLDVSYVAGFAAGGQLEQKLAAAINAGQSPDVMGNNENGYQWKFLDLIQPVDDVAKEMIAKYGTPTPGIQYTTQIDGVWYGVPWFTRVGTAYFARKSWFSDAGLDPVKATDTLQGLPDTLMKISDPSKQRYGWGMSINTSGDGEHFVQVTCQMYGSTLADKTGQIVTLDSPETVNAVTWITDIYTNPKWKNMLPPGVNGWTDTGNNEAWLASKIGYTQNGGTLYAQSVQEGKTLQDDTDFLPQPAGPTGLRLMGQDGNEFWIFKGAKNVDASKDFIRYMLDPVAQKATWKYTPGYCTPAYQSGWSDPVIQAIPIDKQVQPSALATPPFLVPEYPGPATAAAAAVNSQNVYTKMTARVLQGMKPADSVKQAAQEAVQIYQQYGAKGK